MFLPTPLSVSVVVRPEGIGVGENEGEYCTGGRGEPGGGRLLIKRRGLIGVVRDCHARLCIMHDVHLKIALHCICMMRSGRRFKDGETSLPTILVEVSGLYFIILFDSPKTKEPPEL